MACMRYTETKERAQQPPGTNRDGNQHHRQMSTARNGVMPGAPNLTTMTSHMDMASKLFTFTFTFTQK